MNSNPNDIHPMQPPQQTEGERIVRVRFNPSGDDKVDNFKQGIAAMIDEIVANGKDPRTKAITITHLETAAMYGVKSLTA